MKYLWLIWLPLLFLPDMGFQRETIFGTLRISDFLIIPYIMMVFPFSRKKGNLLVNQVTPLMIGFVWWAAISTLLINFRYGYTTDYHIYFGLLKLGKLSLYGFAGILTIKALADEDIRSWFDWSLLVAGVLVGINLVISRQDVVNWYTLDKIFRQVYLDNPISAMMAVFICYIGGLRLLGYGSRTWKRTVNVGLVIMFLGLLLSRGRGGWVAALVGVGYLLYKTGLKRSFLIGVIGVGIIVGTYFQFPVFQQQVDHTLWPDKIYLERYNAGIGGVDDGARIGTWFEEGRKFSNAPILGTGFFHRGDKSKLWLTGSHNFFLQMFLETGLVGGGIVVAIFLKMWGQAGSDIVKNKGLELPFKSSLVAAFVSGLSGEYFYGGMVLFVLLTVYGMVGASPRSSELKSLWNRPTLVLWKNSTTSKRVVAEFGSKKNAKNTRFG